MKNIINNIKENYKWAGLVLLIGIFLGWVFFNSSSEASTSSQTEQSHEGHDHTEEATVWTCSMHPQIKQDKPGKCPICAMDLIPLTSMSSGGDDVDPNEIQMTESAAKLADIQTIIVSKGSPEKTVYMQGKVMADERNIFELTSRFGGRIEELFINFTGQEVIKGEKLATIYSPQLVTAQRELLESRSYKQTRPAIYKAARNKLKLWDITDEQIDEIEANGEPQLYFDVLSPITGTVTMRHVALGDYVKEGKALFKVVDLTHIWVMFDAYESDLPWINLNDEVSFEILSLPSKEFKGNVTFIDPFLNSSTRVAKVRVELDNPDIIIKPGMFTKGLLFSKSAKAEQILIPKSAILWTGKRAIVYVKVDDRENPSFLYREVILGPESGAFRVILDGLEEGEEIATNGVFKIDASAQLQGLPSMMNPDGGVANTGHNHGEMTDHSGHTANTMIKEFEVSEKFKNQLTQFYEAYLGLVEAFITGEQDGIQSNLVKSTEKLQEIDMGLLEGEAHMDWMKHLAIIQRTIKAIHNSKDIEEQRSSFAQMNIAFYKSIKSFGLDNVTTYYQYCPMADRDQGAYWFSDKEEIRNPYFGEMMLKCGETREIIK